MDTQDAAAFVHDPGSWADPAAAARLLAPGLQAGTARRLLASPHTAARASQVLANRLGQGDPDSLQPADRRLALAPAAVLHATVSAAGAVWHDARVMRLLRATEIAAFVERHGPTARVAALRHAAAAPAGADVPSTGLETELGNAVARDGARCLATWIATLPPWAAGRVRLKWPDTSDPPGSPALQAHAVQIIHAVILDDVFS